ncbi:MAG: hypothetical protein K2V38_24490 [Gemmataceae bacterium]|nr:hypothetical protein [Gemmataceae bacterium]
MGGTFSGYRASKRRAVESCRAIDTADLNQSGLLAPGTNRSGALQWGCGPDRKSSVGFALAVGDAGGTLRLGYQIGSPPEAFDYPVRLVTTSCHLGGVRWWFVCPLTANGAACRRRVRKLYLSGRYFGCRHCHQLAYRSSQESDSRVYAALRRGDHLERFADADGASLGQLGFALRVLTFAQKRDARLLDRLDRPRPRRRPKGTTQTT